MANNSIFNSINRFLRPSGVKKDSDKNTPDNSLVTPDSKRFKSIEDLQQQFLDYQRSKISQDRHSRTMYHDVDRISSYQDYRAMDHSPEVSAALNILRDECLTISDKGNILEINSNNARIKNELIDLFKNRLNIDFNLRLWIRELIKYGDYFVKLDIDREHGIYDVMSLPGQEIHREEGFDGDNDSVRFRWETTNMMFESWQIAHFRLLEDSDRIPYGRSILDSARKLWKQLQLAVDAMLVYRITRAPERRIFYIEVGNIEENDIYQYIQQVQRTVKKQPVVDRDGNINSKYDPMNIDEDYFLPIRGEKSSKIDTLPGAANMDQIQDIEFLQNKLFAALQVPKPYLNYAESMPGGSTLSQTDLRFARTINSIQISVLAELRRIANIHLYFLGFEDDVDNFELTLTNPSTQQELLKLETMKSRLEVFNALFTPESTSPVSYTWAMKNVLNFSDADILLILRQKKIEKQIFNEIDKAPNTYNKIGLFKALDDKYEIEGAWEASSSSEGAGGGPGGEDLGGGGFGGASDLGGGFEFGGETEGGEGEGSGEAEAPAPAEPLAEAIKKRKLISNLSDKFSEELLEELFKLNQQISSLDEISGVEDTSDNSLLNKSYSMSQTSKKLINMIEKKILKEDVIYEDEEELNENHGSFDFFEDELDSNES